jgi:hypothetical protein
MLGALSEKGAFYTPAFITRYIVSQLLGRVPRYMASGRWLQEGMPDRKKTRRARILALD